MMMLTLLLSISLLSTAEVWKKPVYVPDENHIPSAEIQQEEEKYDSFSQKEKNKNKQTQAKIKSDKVKRKKR